MVLEMLYQSWFHISMASYPKPAYSVICILDNIHNFHGHLAIFTFALIWPIFATGSVVLLSQVDNLRKILSLDHNAILMGNMYRKILLPSCRIPARELGGSRVQFSKFQVVALNWDNCTNVSINIQINR